MDCTYIALVYLNGQNTLQFLPLIHPFTHTHTLMMVKLQGVGMTIGSHLGIQCLAQGHFDTWTWRPGDHTANPAVSG